MNRYKFAKEVHPEYVVLLLIKGKYITYDSDLELMNYIKFNENLCIFDKYKIGNVCSQILSIFYLSRLDFYIIHTLKCKYMVRYCDDIVIFNNDKELLKEVFKKIEDNLSEYKLKINKKKSFIVNIKNGFIFCGNYIKLDNNKTIINKCRSSRNKIKKNIKKREKMYLNGSISFAKYFSSINSYKIR